MNINAIFFRVFKDDRLEYLTRAWLREPGMPEVTNAESIKGEWNGENYVSFGVYPDRQWEDPVKYGFVSAGGGSWYTTTLGLLEPGARIWVNVPGHGYVGVGEVTESVIPVDDFMVRNKDGSETHLLEMPMKAKGVRTLAADKDKAELLVRVKWLRTVPLDQAVREKGFFCNQNCAARPTTPKWEHAVERLKKRFGVN